MSGGGYGQGQLTHGLGLLFRLLPERATEVAAFTGPAGGAVELHDAIALRFGDGAIGTVSGAAMPWGSFGNSHQVQLRVTGERGQLLLDLDPPLVRRSRGEQDDITVELTEDDVTWSFARVVDRFVDLAQGRTTEIRSPGELGARVVEVLEAMYRSAASGRWEPIAGDLSRLVTTRAPARIVATGSSRWRPSTVVPMASVNGKRPSSSASTATSATAPTASVPNWPSRPIAAAGAVVAIAMTSSSGQAEMEELRQRRHEVVDRPIHVEAMEVGADRVGPEAVGERGLAPPERERARAVADIEQDAPLSRLDRRGMDAPGVVEDPVAAIGERVGDDVAGPQPGHDLVGRGGRVADDVLLLPRLLGCRVAYCSGR